MFLLLKEYYEYDEVEYYPNNNVKEQVESEPSQNPHRQRQKNYKKPVLGCKAQRNYVNGRLSNVGVNNI